MKTFAISMIALALAAVTGPAAATQMFDFDAQAILPATVGGTAEAYGRIVNGTAVDSPLPLDFANYEYTLVVTGLTLDATGATDGYSGGLVVIYEDGGTAADWSDPSTFTDGTPILSGILDAIQHTLLTSTLGDAHGTVDWTGGTRLTDLAPADRTDWPFLTLVSRSVTQVEPGYTEKWDGKVEPMEDVVATESRDWSSVKALFR